MTKLARPSKAYRSSLLSPFNALDSVFDRFFDQDWLRSPFESLTWSSGYLDTDVESDDKALTLTMDVPGADEEDLDITLDGGLLKVAYEKDEQTEEEDAKGDFIYKGRRSGKVERSFQLPDNIDQEAVKASLKNGVLKLVLPKTEAETAKKVVLTSGE